ncbi:hypothetical protein HQ520_03460, partial [bacterium]|nr:hypothetical protein [bacterium]
MRAAFSINVCVCFCTVILAMAPFFSQGQVPYQFDIIPEESPVHVEARLLYNGIEIGSEDVDTRLEGSFSSVYEPSTGTLSTVQVTNLRIEFEDDDIRIEEDRSIGGIGDVTVVIFLRSLEAHMVQEASVSMIGTGGSATIQNHEILLTGVLPWEYVIDPIFGSNIEDDGEETIEESITEEFTYTTSPTLNLVEGETVTARLSFRRNFDEDLGSGFEAEIDVDITAVGRAQVPAGGPSNDDLADAQVISGTMGQVSQSNADATKETGEPDHAGRPGGASLWYSWTAPASGVARFHTFGSDFDTVLGVYVGTGYGDFLEVASNDDLGTVTSALDLRVIQGEMYYVAVDGATATDTGQVHLNWSMLMGAASVWSNDFGLNDGWLAGRNPRFVEDVDGDGRADVVGIADSGVWVALSSGQDFGQPSQWAPGFGFDSGWSEDRHPR